MPGLSASQWAEGHQGRVKLVKERSKPTEKTFAPIRLSTVSQDSTTSSNNSPPTHRLRYPSSLEFDEASQTVQSVPQAVSESSEIENQVQVKDFAIDQPPVQHESDSESSVDAVQEWWDTLITGRSLDELNMLKVPKEKRVYDIRYLLALKTTRVDPRPFLHIAPGRFFDIRKGFKIASLASDRGLTLAQGYEAERRGDFQVEESDTDDEQARRYVSQPIESSEDPIDRFVGERVTITISPPSSVPVELQDIVNTYHVPDLDQPIQHETVTVIDQSHTALPSSEKSLNDINSVTHTNPNDKEKIEDPGHSDVFRAVPESQDSAVYSSVPVHVASDTKTEDIANSHVPQTILTPGTNTVFQHNSVPTVSDKHIKGSHHASSTQVPAGQQEGRKFRVFSPRESGRLTPYSDFSPPREVLPLAIADSSLVSVTPIHTQAVRDRQNLLQLLEQHIAGQVAPSVESSKDKAPSSPVPDRGARQQAPNPMKTTVDAPIVHQFHEEIQEDEPGQIDVQAEEPKSQVAADDTLNTTIALIESLSTPSNSNQSLQEALNLIKLSLLGKIAVAPPTKESPAEATTEKQLSPEAATTASLEFSSKDNSGSEYQWSVINPSAAISQDHLKTIGTPLDTSIEELEEYHGDESAGSDGQSDYSVEIITETQTMMSPQPTEIVPVVTHVEEDKPEEEFVLKDWQIEPVVKYDEILPEEAQPQCHLCNTGKQYKSMNRLLVHFEKRHYLCEKCDLVFLTREELLEHIHKERRVHNYCEECNVDFHTLDGYLRHMGKIHPPPPLPIHCPGCRKHCKDAVDVVLHLENGFCQNIPKAQFNRARVVTALIHRHGLGPVQTCSIDEREEIKMQSFKLLRGDNTIVNGLPLVMQSGWSPFFEAHLHEIQTYNGISYKCPYSDCDKMFKTKDDFIDHLRAGHFEHGVCPGCFKQFQFASALLQHLIRGHRNCRTPTGTAFAYAISALSGGYVKANWSEVSELWTYVAGTAPRADLYMDLPEVAGTGPLIDA